MRRSHGRDFGFLFKGIVDAMARAGDLPAPVKSNHLNIQSSSDYVFYGSGQILYLFFFKPIAKVLEDRRAASETASSETSEIPPEILRAVSILGIHPTATLSEIKKAYHKAAWISHPDRRGGHTGRMSEVNQARDILLKWKSAA